MQNYLIVKCPYLSYSSYHASKYVWNTSMLCRSLSISYAIFLLPENPSMIQSELSGSLLPYQIQMLHLFSHVQWIHVRFLSIECPYISPFAIHSKSNLKILHSVSSSLKYLFSNTLIHAIDIKIWEPALQICVYTWIKTK